MMDRAEQAGGGATNLYLTAIMSSFIKDYVMYLDDCLNAQVLAIDDESMKALFPCLSQCCSLLMSLIEHA